MHYYIEKVTAQWMSEIAKLPQIPLWNNKQESAPSIIPFFSPGTEKKAAMIICAGGAYMFVRIHRLPLSGERKEIGSSARDSFDSTRRHLKSRRYRIHTTSFQAEAIMKAANPLHQSGSNGRCFVNTG